VGREAPSLGNSFRDDILVSSLRVLDAEVSKYPRETFRILDFSVFEDEIIVFPKHHHHHHHHKH
jgi:hypothetical protein